jgi:hypothetical protein
MRGGWSKTEKLRRLQIARKKWLQAKEQAETCPRPANSQTAEMQSIAAQKTRSKRPSTRTVRRLFEQEG